MSHLFKTKMFSAQFIVEKDSTNESWALLNKTEDLDDQINDWVEATQNKIVSTSAPAMHAEWMDAGFTKKVIIVSIVVIYAPTEFDNAAAYPEFRDI